MREKTQATDEAKMSTVLKPAEDTTDLSTVLVLATQMPADFRSNAKYKRDILSAIQTTANLVYPQTDEGEKAMKADAAAINKFAAQFKRFTLDTVKRDTEEVTRWKSEFQGLIYQLLQNRQSALDQFEEARLAKLAEIRSKIMDSLIASWDRYQVKPEYRQGDIEPLVKNSAITESGNLTKKTTESIVVIVQGNLEKQNRTATRYMLIENRCLRADINPPLSHLHFGELFFTADDETFNAKLEALVDEEITRRTEMEARIKKQQEVETQRRIDEALKQQQAEADLIARESAEKSASEQKTEVPKVVETPAPSAPSVNGRRSVIVTAQFRFDGIRDTVSNEGVERFLIGQLSEKLQAIITIQESRNA